MPDEHDFPRPLSDERRQRILERGRARVRRNRRITTAVVAVCVVALATPIALAATSKKESLDTVNPGVTTSVSVPRTTVAPSTTTHTTTTVASTGTTVAGSGAVQNLSADDGLKTDLRTSFLAYKGFASNEIAATTAPGSVYYAFAPETHTYWAVASFTATPAITSQHAIGMQDGGDRGLFTEPSGGTWRMVATVGIPCPPAAPPDVLATWGLDLRDATASLHQTCDALALPVGGPLDLVIGADYYLYPKAWTVDTLHNAGGPESIASAVDPLSPARIDEVLNGGSLGAGGFYLPTHQPNYESPATKGLPGCTLTTWTVAPVGRAFTCQPASNGLQTSGIVVVKPWHEGAAMLRVTLPAADHDIAQVILSHFPG